MVDIDPEELIDEEQAQDSETPSKEQKTVTEQAAEFHEKAEKAREEIKKIKKMKKDTTSKPKEDEPVKHKKSKGDKKGDPDRLKRFLDRVEKECSGIEVVDKPIDYQLRFPGVKGNKGFVGKVLKRENYPFGVWRKDGTSGTWKAYRVYTPEEEETQLQALKKYFDVNSKK